MKKWQKTPVPIWEFSDEFWLHVEPLLVQKERDPKKKYKREIGGGRPSLDIRKVFAWILYVLRTGIQWKALPKDQFGASSSVHRYFTFWVEKWVFHKLWKKGLSEYDEMEGIAWQWQSADGSLGKSPLGKEDVGPNPTDRGKKWSQKKSSGRRIWHPAIDRRLRSE
jgi:transposase